MGLVVEHISKAFAQFHAVTDLSMEVQEGSIFGFLGSKWRGQNNNNAYDSRHSSS